MPRAARRLSSGILREGFGVVLFVGRGVKRRALTNVAAPGRRRSRRSRAPACRPGLCGNRPGFRRCRPDDELVAKIAADRAGVGPHRHGLQPHAREGAQIGHEHLVIGAARAVGVDVEGVAVLHQELAPAHDAEARADLVAELPLDVIENARQVLVRAHRRAEDVGDHFLVRRAVEQIALVAVLDAQHLLAVVVVAPALAPQIGRLQRRHQKLDRACPVLLLAHDLLDLSAARDGPAAATNRCPPTPGARGPRAACSGAKRSAPRRASRAEAA